MTAPDSHPQRLRVAHLNPRAPTPFTLRPDEKTRAAIAEELGLQGLPELELRGELRAEGGDAWLLQGRLTARVVQSCVITLKPVKTDLAEEIHRHYSPHIRPPEGEEIEMPDETLEPLGQFIDLTAVMIEELTLALPQYPRAEDAELPGIAEEETEADTRKPFAGLDKLLKGEGNQG
ncbi:YceD family protein [Paracoccus alkanivorans]|uniref:DUF177 domain-containing protein n=1 Tax=Paracoccus alkanivorans TaxID=2116655 RepID=A0A3M0MFT1_9RHOB|nr:DUF177 domain-containing protein [Paracoccus alkanivorans]RMC36562.1 DUF177 domain-containing protein [Paracoccus alkanivorans]